jgi:hypothetical protein
LLNRTNPSAIQRKTRATKKKNNFVRHLRAQVNSQRAQNIPGRSVDRLVQVLLRPS